MCQNSGKKVFRSETFFIDIPVSALCKVFKRYLHISDPICRTIRLMLCRVKFIGLNNRKLLIDFKIFQVLVILGITVSFTFQA
jgi:hypothetical protein